MPQPGQDIHASLPLRQLRGAQGRLLAPLLRREPARRALRIGVAAADAVPAVPGLTWTRLWLARGDYCGDVSARGGEVLPFADESFDVLWLQHALEAATWPGNLLDEACRVLAPGGLLVVSAVHPLGGWAPWFLWRARGQHCRLHDPWALLLRLRRAALSLAGLQRQGSFWPQAEQGRDHRFGGGYLLTLRKAQRQALPIKRRPVPVGVPVGARLSPGARRHPEPQLEALCDD